MREYFEYICTSYNLPPSFFFFKLPADKMILRLELGAAILAGILLLVVGIIVEFVRQEKRQLKILAQQSRVEQPPVRDSRNLQAFSAYLRNNTCKGCVNWYGKLHSGNLLVCAIHPHGPVDKSCNDWKAYEPEETNE